ncbi:hypothetical protein TWF132_005640 [Orbilia oligospora]|nr:hypothetical protein TWF132_005640 [Orbilia oligospora]
MDIANHPFLKEPIFSPFMTYLSAEESDKQPCGNLEEIFLDNFFIGVNPNPYCGLLLVSEYVTFRWSVEDHAFQVRARDNATIRDLIDFLVSFLKVNDGGDEGYEIILTNLWDIWGKRWVGVLRATIVLA